MIFDGKGLAQEIEERVKIDVEKMASKPKIVSILVGDDSASELYTRLKKSAAERCGIDFLIEKFDSKCQMAVVEEYLEKVGVQKEVGGVMIQLPLPEGLREQTPSLLKMIPQEKDVDGLRWEESGVMPATIKAILSILDKIAESQFSNSLPAVPTAQLLQAGQIFKLGKYVVVGARGTVGRPLVHYLRERGAGVTEVEWNTNDPVRRLLAGEVVISCTGKEGIVTGEMVREGVVAIDVGSPKGDMTQEVYEKASVYVPSPGGVGPVTIACLLENAVSML